MSSRQPSTPSPPPEPETPTPSDTTKQTESRPASHLSGAERFEWLETWVDRPAAVGDADLEAQRARRCPLCQWLDSVAELECFRCGHVFEFDELTGSGDQTTGASLRAPPLVLRFTDSEPRSTGPNASPRVYELRRRVLAQGLLPGFERLLSLSEVNLELFEHYDHQKDVALKALRDMQGCALLADETGLGKTIEAGLIAKELIIRRLAHSMLIIVPASLIPQWQEELAQKFALPLSVVRSASDLRHASELVIVSYATIRSKVIGKALRERPWDLLICDEAHYLKNRNTKQYKAVNRIAKKYVLLLSATPFHNRLIELKNLLDLLKPGLFGSTRAFNKQYVDRADPRRPLNVHHLKTLLSEVMIRNRRNQVLVELPPRRACIVHLEASDSERTFYEDVSRFISKEVRHLLGRHKANLGGRPGRLADRPGARARGGRSYSYVLALVNLQREACSSPEAVAKTLARMSQDEAHPTEVRAHLAELAERARGLGTTAKARALFEVLERFEGKLVVFCEYVATIDALSAALTEAGIESVTFTGRLDVNAKVRALETFRDRSRVLVASRAGGEGLNIQFAQNMVNFDLPWNPMAVEQRIGRLHRLGQKNEVQVFNLSVRNTIEARVLELLTNKIQLFTTVIGEIDLILGSLEDDRGFEQMLRDTWVETQLEEDNEAFDALSERIVAARVKYEDLQKNQTSLDEMGG